MGTVGSGLSGLPDLRGTEEATRGPCLPGAHSRTRPRWSVRLLLGRGQPFLQEETGYRLGFPSSERHAEEKDVVAWWGLRGLRLGWDQCLHYQVSLNLKSEDNKSHPFDKGMGRYK